MRSTPLWLVLIYSATLLWGCTSETTPVVYIGMTYQVRCLDCQPRVPDDNVRDIRVVDGEAGFKLDCSVTKSGGVRRVTFSAEHKSSDSGDNFALVVSKGRLGGDESDGPCHVRLIEGDNTYVGDCSTADPSVDRPCQVHFDLKGNVISGSLYCDKIPNQSTLNSVRYVVDSHTNADPAKFELYGCRGL